MNKADRGNRLAGEKSPYLLQHANNPVDWYPWGEEAFRKAGVEDKPIFLSIGYSTCHWCHVMERESFEDREVASLLNQHFISVKVDREERPDLDQIYMAVCQALTGQGGWPLTVLLTPEKKPFFAGTYFPKRRQGGRPGLMELLPQLNQIWVSDRKNVLDASDQLTQAITSRLTEHSPLKLDEAVIHDCFHLLSAAFDPLYGGFGPAPKFPSPHILCFLMRYWWKHREKRALQMVEKTLLAMYQGGLYDHIGFGFSRYATDDKWLVPHFEKMLYDNALLTIAFLEAYLVAGNKFHAEAAREILDYLAREMTSPDGGFYSAQDADSEGAEGKFYLWDVEEIEKILGKDEAEAFTDFYNMTARGNFEGRNIPNLIDHPDKIQKRQRFNNSREKLLARRNTRIPPHKDNKILTSWNGLMIAAFALAGRTLADPGYVLRAQQAASFVLNNLRRKDGRLMVRYCDGEAAILGYLDDYAFFIWGLLELYAVSFKEEYLRLAISLTDDLIKYHWDEINGGFYTYASDGEQLIARPKEIYDGATPSGNSVATLNMFKLARLTGRFDLEEKARRTMTLFGSQVKNYPPGFTYLLMALQFSLGPSREVVLVEGRPGEGVTSLSSILNNHFLPQTVCLKADEKVKDLIPSAAAYQPVGNMTTAYVCQDQSCLEPVTKPAALLRLLI